MVEKAGAIGRKDESEHGHPCKEGVRAWDGRCARYSFAHISSEPARGPDYLTTPATLSSSSSITVATVATWTSSVKLTTTFSALMLLLLLLLFMSVPPYHCCFRSPALAMWKSCLCHHAATAVVPDHDRAS